LRHKIVGFGLGACTGGLACYARPVMAWKCPKCEALVRYQDYNHVLSAVPFRCHSCGRPLVVDATTGEIIVAPDTLPAPPKPFRVKI
jgi:hypothetical protein